MDGHCYGFALEKISLNLVVAESLLQGHGLRCNYAVFVESPSLGIGIYAYAALLVDLYLLPVLFLGLLGPAVFKFLLFGDSLHFALHLRQLVVQLTDALILLPDSALEGLQCSDAEFQFPILLIDDILHFYYRLPAFPHSPLQLLRRGSQPLQLTLAEGVEQRVEVDA